MNGPILVVGAGGQLGQESWFKPPQPVLWIALPLAVWDGAPEAHRELRSLYGG